MTIRFHEQDLPPLDSAQMGAYASGCDIALDTETSGLQIRRDRLCLVQLSPGDGSADIIRIKAEQTDAPNLKSLLEDPGRTKIFHFGRFDIAVLSHWLGIEATPVFCTKIASRLTRTYTERHGLKDIVRELLGAEISKQQQSSDWAAEKLSREQLAYAASDVLYLHRLRDQLLKRLVRESRSDLAKSCFEFLPTRAQLDLAGWSESDIFAHS